MKKNKVIIIILIFALIIISAFLTNELIQYINDENKKNIKTNTNINNTIKNEENINSSNNYINENENNNNNNNSNNNQIDEEATEQNIIQTNLDNQQKAIQIVKENWGEDSTVYFRYDDITAKGEYIICVRDKETTNALYFYTVNVETGAFTIE